MSLFRKLKLKRPIVYALCLTGAFMVFYACANTGSSKEDSTGRREIAFRDIGHKLLLHAGDSTSRVLPVKKIAANEYRIQFANDFAFEPDTLVAIVERTLASAGMEGDYVVNVLDCTTAESVFGFAIAKEEGSILPCSGRLLPKSCYLIDITFEQENTTMQTALPGTGVLVVLVAAAAGWRRRRCRKPAPPQDALMIGNTLLDAQNKRLVIHGIETALTAKECSLLALLAASPNEVIDRSRLQKELWEDQGIIVGRSLDVFISRLRKKLEGDEALKLVNIHGKGYKLEIS